MFCKNCGKEFEGTSICPECGTDNTVAAPVSAEQNASNQPELIKKSNICAILGFAWSFFMPLVGLILGIVGLAKAKEYIDPKKGLATAAVIIGGLSVFFALIYVVVFIAVFVQIMPQLSQIISEYLPEIVT